MDYLQFRSWALSGRALIPNKDYPNHWSKDDWERWVKKNYLKHYNEDGTPKREV